MLKALRVALVALGTVCTLTFSGPAFAGMVATPEPVAPVEELQAAQDSAILRDVALRSGLSAEHLEVALAAIPAEQRATLTAAVVSSERAGNLLGAAALVAGVIIVGVIILSEMLWDKGNLKSYNP